MSRYTELDEREINLGVFIDFQKAFDTNDHDILIRKMTQSGIWHIFHIEYYIILYVALHSNGLQITSVRDLNS